MAIRERTNSSGKTRYLASYRDDAGKEQSRSFDRKADAERWLTERRREKQLGELYVDEKARRQTFGEYAERWLSLRDHRGETARSYETVFRLHILPTFASRPLRQIRPADVQDWILELAKDHSPASVKTYFVKLLGVFRSALDDELITRNPCRNVTLPKARTSRLTIPTVDEVHAMAEAVGPRFRAMVYLAATAGLRYSEVRGLTPNRIDWLARPPRVTVDRQLDPHPGAGFAGRDISWAEPKSHASNRVVPLPALAVEELSIHLRRYPALPDALVFTMESGRPVTHFLDRILRENTAQCEAIAARTIDRCRRRAQPGRRVCGIHLGDDADRPCLAPPFRPELVFHDLRHFYASALINQGRSPVEVAHRMGHASVQTTLNTYGHLWPDHEEMTASAIDAVFAEDQDDADLAV